MYTRKVQILNYGPIGHLDIDLPFDGDAPKPVVLVGENGTGKTILLSHIVNGLAAAQGRAYPETPVVDQGRVYKIRSSSYIKSGGEYSFGRVDFEAGLFLCEVATRRLKQDYETMPLELLGSPAKEAWDQMEGHKSNHVFTNFGEGENKIRDIFYKNCVLYFPSNRFEEPAWLNEENLNAKAKYMDITHVAGHTSRRMINYSPLRDIQDWLFGVIYDRIAFEPEIRDIAIDQGNKNPPLIRPAIIDYSGTATSIYGVVLELLRRVMRGDNNARLHVGHRTNRVISLEGDTGLKVPNVFHLSSGETSVLNLFFFIMRDFDLCRASFEGAESVRGIAVVDEIDLHLHAVHQHEVLPGLMRMFPNVQFIVTTHSPLFVLGMKNVFGEDGFGLYQLPHGEQIDPEEFSEFGNAYRTLTATRRFSSDLLSAIKNAQTPLLYLEGTTDRDYLKRAAQLLGELPALDALQVRDGGGASQMQSIWKSIAKLPEELVPRKLVLLYDCDVEGGLDSNLNRFRRKIPRQSSHPIEKGIENLFGKSTLEKARSHKPQFIDTTAEHPSTVRGQHRTIPERWTINDDEKRNLCDWLCANGTAEDFQHFQVIFDLLDEVLGAHQTEE